MDCEEAELKSDFFLREIPNVKISQERKKEVPKSNVKEEIKVLHLSDNSQQMIMETLRFIHGPDYSLDDISKYKDEDLKFTNKFLQHNNLVVKGGFYNTNNDSDSEHEKLRMFALLKLESYGFHKSHCAEALDYTSGDLESALYLLYTKYMSISQPHTSKFSESELIEQRRDEKSVLESIYESAFTEKIVNAVWTIKLNLNYLVTKFHPKRHLNQSHSGSQRRKDLCRNFASGHCKFGTKCKYFHKVQEEPRNPHLDDYTFELEIRFGTESRYPYEPPLLFLKTNFLLPELMNLHICKRLAEEAHDLAQNGIPSIYSIVELLKNEDVMTEYINTSKISFLLPAEKLFPTSDIKERVVTDKYYKKGSTNSDNKKQSSHAEILSEDTKIFNRFLTKMNDSSYQRMAEVRKKLPAWNLRKEIVNTVQSSPVTVISGETGCGKSTQVPQFLLDDWLDNYKSNKTHIEIICTQPRRISAIGVAERVADERAERIGNTVGYQIRLESKISSSTRLTFCTTGVLLRRLESDPELSTVSHIIVDEVHERSEDSDFLLLILRDLLKIRTDLKVILMSATLKSTLFSNYFGSVPVLEIPGRTFPVEQFFLEDILETTGFILEENTQYTRKMKTGYQLGDELEEQLELCAVSQCPTPKDEIKDEKLTITQMLVRYKEYSVKTVKNLFLMDCEKINLDLIEAILLWIVSGDHEYPREGSILVFLPGIAEITSLFDQLCDHSEFSPRRGKYILLPLHSSLTSDEQAAIFKKPKPGVRKIVLSTNLAETSVTIDDCVFVIDSGKMKEKRFDSNRNMESLDTVWVTKANALQRKGRAGRVMPGVCIHLFTGHRFKHNIPSQPIAEIHRIPLEQLLLHIKILPNFAGRSLHDVLDSTIEPPVKENIDSSIVRLQDVGAFDIDNNLTPLGQHLATLPVDVRIGKLMLYGAIFSCVDAALTMAAALSYKSPFTSPFGKKEQAMAKKKEFSVANSDHLTVLRAYKKWQDVNSKSYIGGKNFANENYLSVRTLEMLADIKYQLLELLVSIGFVSINLRAHRHRTGYDEIFKITGLEFNKNGDNIRLLMSILCTALYPNIVKVLTPQTVFFRSAAGAVPVEREAKELRFKTKKEEVFLHPSSVNFTVTNFHSPYLVYQEKVRTSRIFIRDCSMVPVLPLVLFSGSDVNISVNGGTTYIVLSDGWIRFHVEKHQIAEMIKAIRTELLSLLEEKIRDPLLNLVHSERGERIINTIVQIATCD
uniref:RNA helicase n=1 Tax=Photinus pyralis TaxID=7054 RepID=A0A1Y1K8X3_PHOPY